MSANFRVLALAAVGCYLALEAREWLKSRNAALWAAGWNACSGVAQGAGAGKMEGGRDGA